MPRPRTRKGNYTNYSFWLDIDLRIDLDKIAEDQNTTLPRLIEKILKDYVKSTKS